MPMQNHLFCAVATHGTFLRYQKASEACEDRRSLLKETRNVQFKVPRWVSRAPGPLGSGRFMEIHGDSWDRSVIQPLEKIHGYDGESTVKTQRGELG